MVNAKKKKQFSTVFSDSDKQIITNQDKSVDQLLTFPIVGVGGSAGSLEIFKELLKATPPNSGMAYIIIQHLDPKLKSNLAEILSRETKIPVVIITNNMKIEVNHAYVLPPNKVVTISDGILKLVPRLKSTTIPNPINDFLFSLAANIKENAVAVILSGMGNDGTAGVEAIHLEGGITIAQDPTSAVSDSMPIHAIETGCVDYISSSKEIAALLTQIKGNPLVESSDRKQITRSTHEGENYLQQLFHIVKKNTSVDFTDYKKATIERRIQRRMIKCKVSSLKEYVVFIKENPHEINKLFNDLLINVTSFFRDPESFEILNKKIIPKILKHKTNGTPLRIWIAGCSTGEEAYSVSMIILEQLNLEMIGIDIQIFATDISEKMIKKARAGFYHESIKDEISSSRLQQFFIKVANGYKINKKVREMCIFAVHDITNDPPFSKMDLIFCRNLLIYFAPVLQERVISALHYGLNPDGYLVLGNSEGLNGFTKDFNAIDEKHRIYSNKSSKKRNLLDAFKAFTPRVREVETSPSKEIGKKVDEKKELFKLADQVILEKFCPSGVLINKDMQILQFKGDTSDYLKNMPGSVSYNLLKMAHAELRFPINTLITEAKKSKTSEKLERNKIKLTDKHKFVNINLIPIKLPYSNNEYFVITFTEMPTAHIKNTEVDENNPKEKSQIKLLKEEIKYLESELTEARELLQETVEDYESTNEELKSSSEEILSSNEELQSTNEELQTAKEEIQSTNEELSTLNEELEIRNAELDQSINDVNNLLSSTQIPVVVLGSDLRIRHFTKSATTVFRIVQSDIGRSINDIKVLFDHDNLVQQIAEVSETLHPYSHEIKDEKGHWYNIAILPYRTKNKSNDGVIITFNDINALKVRSAKVRRLATIVTDSLDAITVQDFTGKISAWNKGAEKMYGYSMEDALKMNITDIVPSSLAEGSLSYIKNLQLGKGVSSLETQRVTKDGNLIDVWLTSTILNDDDGKPVALATIERDITDRIKTQELSRELVKLGYTNKDLKKYIVEANQALADEKVINEMKSRFISMASHEFRTPLAGILVSIALIKRYNTPEQAHKNGKHIKTIERSVMNLTTILNDFLSLDKLDHGFFRTNNCSFNLIKLVNDIAEDITDLSLGNPKIKYEHKGLEEEIYQDIDMLRNILINLLSNAAKYSPKDKDISIETEICEKNIQLMVRDHGMGIPQEEQKFLFERFFRAKNAENIEGTGLGLNIVKRYIDLMGGTISFASQENVGTTFILLFPKKIKE